MNWLRDYASEYIPGQEKMRSYCIKDSLSNHCPAHRTQIFIEDI
jgi:hypothetical protein